MKETISNAAWNLKKRSHILLCVCHLFPDGSEMSHIISPLQGFWENHRSESWRRLQDLGWGSPLFFQHRNMFFPFYRWGDYRSQVGDSYDDVASGRLTVCFYYTELLLAGRRPHHTENSDTGNIKEKKKRTIGAMNILAAKSGNMSHLAPSRASVYWREAGWK